MLRCSFQLALLACTACFAVSQHIPPVENSFDVVLREGGIIEMNTLEEMDQNFHSRAGLRSESTLSKLDLKAPGRAQHELEKGVILFSKKDFKNAVEHLAKAIEIYPQFVSAHNALGCAYFSLGQKDLALREFNTAIQLDDHVANSYMNLGRVELSLDRNGAAQAAFRKASAITPLDSKILLVLTYTEYLNHDYAGAIKTAEQAHSHGHSSIAVVHYFAAASWQAQHNLPKTAEELQAFLTEDPRSPFADQARLTIQQIQTAEAQPELASATAPTFLAESSVPSRLGEKTLQDLKERKEIAEAGSAEAGCPECGASTPTSPPSTEHASEPRPAALSATGTWSFRSSVDEVAMFFTVTDHGRSIANLDRSEVNVFDDKKPPQSVLSFRTERDLPLRLGLIIDTSQSITYRFQFEQAAAIDFLKAVLTGKGDMAFAAGFSNSVVLVNDFTSDLQQLSHGVNQLVPVGGTALWDAISFAADKMADHKESQPVARMIVVISDGDDNASTTTLKEAIECAERNEVSVYTVSTREVDPDKYSETTGNRAMKSVAELTGGAAFFPGSASHLKRSLSELQQVIRSRYLISYRPAQFHRDGRYRTVQITASRSGHNFKVNARRGYYSHPN
jgi:Ca-activated chloride channel family protein